MISFLKGKIKATRENSIILLCGFIGYKVHLNKRIIFTLPSIDQEKEIAFFTYQTFSDYGSSLFGFKTEDELQFFEKLIQVSGVGPKLAMGIMESPIDMLRRALINKDTSLLVELPGIGKKTAERLCVELASKMDIKFATTSTTQNTDSNKTPAHSTPLSNEEAFMALQALGFSRLEAHRMIATVPSTVFDTEKIVKIALKSKS